MQSCHIIDMIGTCTTRLTLLEDRYGTNGIEKIDLLVGCLCESLPKGFGFSDTAFRVSILIASRRLKSDRFIAWSGWSEKVNAKEGMAWVQNNPIGDVLKRHLPELAPTLEGLKMPLCHRKSLQSFRKYNRY
jgi:hypothetical protein